MQLKQDVRNFHSVSYSRQRESRLNRKELKTVLWVLNLLWLSTKNEWQNCNAERRQWWHSYNMYKRLCDFWGILQMTVRSLRKYLVTIACENWHTDINISYVNTLLRIWYQWHVVNSCVPVCTLITYRVKKVVIPYNCCYPHFIYLQFAVPHFYSGHYGYYYFHHEVCKYCKSCFSQVNLINLPSPLSEPIKKELRCTCKWN